MPLPLRAAPPPPRQHGRWTGGAEGPSVPGPRSRSPELGSVPAPAPLPAPSRLSRRQGPLGVLPRPFPARHSLPLLALPPPAYRAALFGFHSVWALPGGWAQGAGGRAHRPWGPKSVADRPPSPGLQFCRRDDGRWWCAAPQATARSKRSSSPLLAPLSRRPTKHPELGGQRRGDREWWAEPGPDSHRPGLRSGPTTHVGGRPALGASVYSCAA